MAFIYPQAVEAIRSVKPDAMIICEIYEHFLPIPKPESAWGPFGYGISAQQAEILSALPKDVSLAWVADMCLDQWKETDRVPEPLKDHRHIMRAHYGTQWFSANGRHRLELDKIQKTSRLTALAGMERTSYFGESSVFNANNELNYLSAVYFAAQPFDSVEDFLKNSAGDLLGGAEAAEAYYRINKNAAAGAVSAEDIDIACGYVASLKEEQRRRWIWLSSYISSIRWDNTALTV